MPKELGTGLRYNTGKPRFGLITSWALAQLARILTIGATKYADRNWEAGMSWSGVVDSLERHLAAFKTGEDYDPETGELHIAHVMCNAMFLTEYYRIYPQGDDRPKWWANMPKWGLDVDDVLADFAPSYCERFGIKELPDSWNFDPGIKDRMPELIKDKEFWVNLPVKTPPSELFFEPTVYVSSRACPSEWTAEWLTKNGYPVADVVHVDSSGKAEVLKAYGVGMYVDDGFHHFRTISDAGIHCWLMSCPHNERYPVGHHRVRDFREILQRIKGEITPTTRVIERPE